MSAQNFGADDQGHGRNQVKGTGKGVPYLIAIGAVGVRVPLYPGHS